MNEFKRHKTILNLSLLQIVSFYTSSVERFVFFPAHCLAGLLLWNFELFLYQTFKKKSQNKPQSNKCSIIFIFVRNIFGRSTELLDGWLNDTRSVRKISNTPCNTWANFKIYYCFGFNILLQIFIIIRHNNHNNHILRIFTSQTKF